MSSGRNRTLIERARELDVLADALRIAGAGEGRMVVVEGPPGIGKSGILQATHDAAVGAGIQVLAARGHALEREFGFGVARQLFERVLVEAERLERSLSGPAARAVALLNGGGPGPEPPGDSQELLVAHSLYWLTVHLAERAPLLLVVDDLHWADMASIRFLAYLQHRLADIPVAAVLATRFGERPALVEGLVNHPDATMLRPAALSPGGVRALVSGALPGAAEEILDACARVSAGNPLLVHELIRTMRAEAWTLDAQDAHRLDDVASVTIAHAALTRLRLLGAAAERLARALAVLGDEAPLRRAAALAGVEASDAVPAADSLASAAILADVRPLRFVHSLVANAVYEEIPAAQRADMQLRAARLLAEDPVAPEILAAHLLLARADGAAWVVETLRAAAAAAAARGDQGAVRSYLARALQEPPPPAEQGAVLLALGCAEAVCGRPQALSHLEQALERTNGPRARAEVLAMTGRALVTSGRMRDAASAFCRGSDELALASDYRPHEELALELRASRALAALYGTAATAEVLNGKSGFMNGHLAPRTRGERSLLGAIAGARVLRGEDRAGALALARRAWDGGALLADATSEGLNAYTPCFVMTNAGELEEALGMCEAAVAEAQERGSPMGYANACYWRVMIQYRMGRLAEAVADGEAVIEAATQGWTVAPAGAAGLLAICLIDRDELERAVELLARFAPAPGSHDAPNERFHEAAATVALAQGDPRRALDSLEECERLSESGGCINPSVNDWRSIAALAHGRLGDLARAKEIAGGNLALARAFGDSRAIGIALRTAGLIAPADERAALLGEAVATLRTSQAELELARALLELGAHIRRARMPSAAREPLREALALAERCHANALSRRALEELAASGARPRRTALHGPDALTPAERRVALLVADGMTNRQIAQALFVTPKTVEKHVSNAYHKLRISSRRALRDALRPSLDATS